ncbi:ruBisCO large subunit-binding protein subunit alpha, chloroplastic-like [Gossypium australe]|uniref:RuBisCO large subunit-binding protein subunit alpha, chloroplastic-like n=1 Tax=Gossypium australe TaxID=47621 RepID=A0A5B6WMZ6_9ROSI|nr:ruBisCO large subunit-binding protein subunit alpha, chloroplastic-like [Gossypium australe]
MGKPPQSAGIMISSRGTTKDSVVRSEAKAPARAYAIRTREDALSPNVITGTFSLDDTNLTLHDSVVNCRRKNFELKCQISEIIQIESDESSELSIVISFMLAQRYVRKASKAYLAYVLDTKVSESKIESVPVVCEYPNVFP